MSNDIDRWIRQWTYTNSQIELDHVMDVLCNVTSFISHVVMAYFLCVTAYFPCATDYYLYTCIFAVRDHPLNVFAIGFYLAAVIAQSVVAHLAIRPHANRSILHLGHASYQNSFR